MISPKTGLVEKGTASLQGLVVQKPMEPTTVIPPSRWEYPIRVVDVAATLTDFKTIIFKAPKDWGFHVISHTWSGMVRDLSKMLGEQTAQLDDAAEAYDRAFREVDLSGNGCYAKLRELLGRLAGDGVEAVWMDALCINQCDAEEKNAEIGRMGDYYRNSRGCYVLPHGIGPGYYLWPAEIPRITEAEEPGRSEITEAEEHGRWLPRWFYRVWTLQEYVLPKQLWFLIGSLSPATIRLINTYISHNESAVGFCECCIKGNYFRNVTDFQEQYTPDHFVQDGEADCMDILVAEDQVCDCCGSSPYIRSAGYRGEDQAGSTIVYFADYRAYQILLFLSATFTFPSAVEDVIVCCNNMALLRDALNPSQVVLLMGRRDCTHEEDRILSILGLLEAKGIKQVRTDLSLEEQVVNVASQDHNLAFFLCTVSGSSFFQKPGLSWAGNIRKMDGSRLIRFRPLTAEQVSRLPYRISFPEVEITQVSQQGLALSAKVIRLPFRISVPESRCFIKFNSSIWRETVFRWPVKTSRDSILLNSSCLQFCHDLTKDQVEFDIWIILLGFDSVDTSPAGMKLLAMLCVGLSVSNLHNLGHSFFRNQDLQEILSTSERKECLVGGFGTHVPSGYLLNLNV